MPSKVSPTTSVSQSPKKSTAPKKQKKSNVSIKDSLYFHSRYSRGVEWDNSVIADKFHALALTVREKLIDGLIETESRVQRQKAKRLYYLSLEFLMGRSLHNNLSNLECFDEFQKVLKGLGVNLSDILESESDAALGNGGLGRLAACFLDSMATLGVPGYGYGINYEFGLFKQEIDDQGQKEKPDQWLWVSSPWLIERKEEACVIPLFGYVEDQLDRDGNYNPMWMGWKTIIGIPHDLPIVGYGGKTVNFLRLFSARSSDQFDMEIFNNGDYVNALREKVTSETISKVLYPSDTVEAGKQLRLIQEYFLVACSLRDLTRRYLKEYSTFENFPNKVAIQLNDTHPALTVVELMRIFVDEHQLSWDIAWEITTATCGYTNHTLLPEALEKWPVPLMRAVLPRHLQIIHEINRRFLEEVKNKWPLDSTRLPQMSIIEESVPQQIRMANLSIIGSHSVNGVAALHTELVKSSLVPHFHQLWPAKFNNKTNGITQRRWLLQANPLLADLITSKIGKGWITNLEDLKQLEASIHDSDFCAQFSQIKHANKKRLAHVIYETTRTTVSPDSIFVVQAKRIHEYKRQLLNVMHIIHQYFSITEEGKTLPVPHTYVFAGKAAPGYWAAKEIIHLIHQVAQRINHDPRVKDQIKVVFIPDFRVSLAEHIYPAADLSEQISTAGMEASGTGNMKFALNGALTIGTLDGANIEIMEEVGRENIFIFGLTAEKVSEMREQGTYKPWELYHSQPRFSRILDALSQHLFCHQDPGRFSWIFDSILKHGDHYFHLADLESYIDAHELVAKEYLQKNTWTQKGILNVARMGKFSSDRTIMEYAKDIWNVSPHS